MRMKFEDAATFRQSLEQCLQDRAAGDEARLDRFRRHVVFDRLLARLVDIAPGQWALTGGLALDLRLSAHAGISWQLELEWWGDHLSGFQEAPPEIATRDLGDYFEFEIQLSGRGSTGRGGHIHFEAHASLDGSPFESVSLVSR